MSVNEELHLSAFEALQEMRKGAEAETTSDLVPVSKVVAYARRTDCTADLALERSLRRNDGLRAVYRRALSGVARASSLRAAAAAEAQVARRAVGDYVLEIVREFEDMSWLVLRIPEGAAPVTMIELRGSDGAGRRLDLGQPIDGVLQLPLDQGFAELAGIADLLSDPATEIHLL